jgi:hypothetical protein
MRCLRCKSINTFRFLDAFGNRRIFCRKCWGSWLEQSIIEFGNVKEQNLLKHIFYQNNKAIKTQV